MVVVLGEYLLPHYPTGMCSRGNVIMLGTGQRRLDTRHIASSLPSNNPLFCQPTSTQALYSDCELVSSSLDTLMERQGKLVCKSGLTNFNP